MSSSAKLRFMKPHEFDEEAALLLAQYQQKSGMLGRYRFTLAHEAGHWQLHRHLFKRDTVQLFITTVWAKVFVNGLSFLCSGRHFFQRDIFRLITRGFIRLRRAGIFSQLISQTTASNHSLKLVAVRASHSGRRVFRI